MVKKWHSFEFICILYVNNHAIKISLQGYNSIKKDKKCSKQKKNKFCSKSIFVCMNTPEYKQTNHFNRFKH